MASAPASSSSVTHLSYDSFTEVVIEKPTSVQGNDSGYLDCSTHIEDKSERVKKNLFINNLIDVRGVMPTVGKQKQIKLLAEMFNNLFLNKVPEEIPDFRVINEVFKTTIDQSGKKCLQGRIKMSSNPSEGTAKRKIDQTMFQMAASAEMLPEFIRTTLFTTPIDKNSALIIKKWLRNEKYTKVLEVGAGLGWWSAALSHKGGVRKPLSSITVTATDSREKWAQIVDGKQLRLLTSEHDESPRDPKQSESVHRDSCDAKDKPSDNLEVASQPETTSTKLTINSPHPVEGMSARGAIEKYANEHDILLITDPTQDIVSTLKFWPSGKPILWVSNCKLSTFIHDKLGITVECEKVKTSIDNLVLTMPMNDKPTVIEVVRITKWPTLPAEHSYS